MHNFFSRVTRTFYCSNSLEKLIIFFKKFKMVKVLKLGSQKKYRFTRRIRRFFLTLLPFTLELKGRQYIVTLTYCTVYSIVFGSTRTFLCGKGVRAPVLRIAELVPDPDSDYTVNFCCPKNAGAKLFGQIYWKQNVCDNFVNLVNSV